MLMKLTALIKGKVALAALGVLLVGGGGATVAVAASNGQLHALGLQAGAQNTAHASASGTPGKGRDGSHVEGLLTACDASAGTIKVTDEQGKAYSYVVKSTTRFVGDTGAHAAGATTAYGLTQLCALTSKVKVQVQATATTSGSTTTLTADKITVEGPGTGDSQSGAGAKPSETPGAKPEGTPGARPSETPGARAA